MTLSGLTLDQLYELRSRVTSKKPHMSRANGWNWHASNLRLIEARIDMEKMQREKQRRV